VARKIGQRPRFPQGCRQSNGALWKSLTQIKHDLRRAWLSLKQKDAASAFEMLLDRDGFGDRMWLGTMRPRNEHS
jgi:hypothetical protein